MRRRILLLVVGMTTLVVLAFAIPIALLVRTAVAQRADRSAMDRASNVSVFLRNGALTTARIRAYVAGQTDATGLPISVLTPDGTVIGSTPNDTPAPVGAPPGGGGGGDGGPVGDQRAAQVQLHAVPGGQEAVAVSPAADGSYLVRVYLSDANRYAGLTGWYALLVAGSVGLLIVGAAAGEVLTRRVARPLVRTAQTAQRLSVGDTTARAPVDGPREVADVGKALNRLADRIDELIAEERETVADLSHRLRTPLTTLRLDAEALRDPDESDRVTGHVNDLERTLTAVIRAARRPQREGRLPSCDAAAVVGERVEFWSALTDEQGRPSSVSLPAGPVPVRAAGEDLAAAVDALLENVIAHTPEGTPFAVALRPSPSGALLVVSDDGPGIPADAEVRGRSDRGSSGLGLDIARRCAEATGGTMTIARTAAGGAEVMLDLHAP